MSTKMFLALSLFAAACASGPRPQPQAAARIKDTAPERIAAQRSATPNLGLEQSDERWGVEAARERRRQADERKAAAARRAPPAAAPGPAQAPANASPVDLQKPQ